MKKVLLIAYFFPPHSSIGSQRAFGLAKNLPKFGWEPTVLTTKLPGRSLEDIKIVETGYKDIKKKIRFITGTGQKKIRNKKFEIAVTKDNFNLSWKSTIVKLIKEIILFPDERKGWYSFACSAASQLLDVSKFDAIISTSPPEISHMIAAELKRKYGLRWIADFRDPWSQKYANRKSWLISFLEKRIEMRTISYADILVSVTKPYVDRIRVLHNKKKIFCVTNGYNNCESNRLSIRLRSKFTITYTGYLYRGKRDPSILFLAIEQLIKEKKIHRELIEIRFYGPKENWIFDEIKKYNLHEIIKIYGFRNKDEIFLRQRESQLLLLIRWNSRKDMGDCPAKIFEYLNAKRPVIAIGGCGGIVKQLLEETNAGKFADNLESLKSILLEYYNEFIQNGRIECKSNRNINDYTYNSIAQKYSKILNSISNNND